MWGFLFGLGVGYYFGKNPVQAQRALRTAGDAGTKLLTSGANAIATTDDGPAAMPLQGYRRYR